MVIKNRFELPVRRLVSLIGAGCLLLIVGAVVTRGPSRRDAPSPVTLSRASGLAAQTSDSNPLLAGDSGVSGPYLATSGPAADSGNLRNLPLVRQAVKDVKPELEAPASEKSPRAALTDSAVQAPARPAKPSQSMPQPLQNFAGLGFTSVGTGWPPDTNGDVGPNYYVQAVNTGIGIFSKTGTLLNAISLNTLFTNAAAPCNAANNGDPVVLYDAQADHWIVADFSWIDLDNGPYYECIAASKTGDPTGDWRLYTLRADDASHPWLNDYPKLGVWPDGIYMSANMFDCNNGCSNPSTTYNGARLWALNRDDLYSGNSLHAVLFDVSNSYFSLLPSNFRGASPPVGTPNYFVSNDGTTTALDVWKFHIDWTNTANSTLTGPAQVVETAYTAPPATVPALNGNGLDTLNDRLMMQNQYRNISGTESLWIAHTAGDSPINITGIRWYQLDVTGGTVATNPVQQSTYKPADGLYRWMPSLAVDKFGNMAVGYSTSSLSQFPAIRYAGRLVTDTVNTLGQDETILVSGSGSQNINCGGTCIRWGDYSAMTVDPVDDCTFWYTTEYYTASGGDWQTRIGSFRFPICGPVPPPLTPQAYLPAIFINGGGASNDWTNLMQEGFEGTWPGAGWQVTDPGFDEYYWAKRACLSSSGNNSAWAMGGGSQGAGLACGASYINGSNAWMVYGPFSLADATAAELQSQLWLLTESGPDSACLMASVDNIHFFTSNVGTCFTGDSGGVFVPETLNLNDVYTLGNLDGQPSVWIAVIFQSNDTVTQANGAFVDDLLLRKCTNGACPPASTAALASRLHGTPATLIRPGNVGAVKTR